MHDIYSSLSLYFSDIHFKAFTQSLLMKPSFPMEINRGMERKKTILAFVESLLQAVPSGEDAFLTFKIITLDKNLYWFVSMCNFNLYVRYRRENKHFACLC